LATFRTFFAHSVNSPHMLSKSGKSPNPEQGPGYQLLFRRTSPAAPSSCRATLLVSSKTITTRLDFTSNCNTPTHNPISFWHQKSLHNSTKITTPLDHTSDCNNSVFCSQLIKALRILLGDSMVLLVASAIKVYLSQIHLLPVHRFPARDSRPPTPGKERPIKNARHPN